MLIYLPSMRAYPDTLTLESFQCKLNSFVFFLNIQNIQDNQSTGPAFRTWILNQALPPGEVFYLFAYVCVCVCHIKILLLPTVFRKQK